MAGPAAALQPGDILVTVRRNRDRVANVWLDAYADTYFATSTKTVESTHTDTTDEVAQRASLKCESFEWYLTNVLPSLVGGAGASKTPQATVSDTPAQGEDPFAEDEEEGDETGTPNAAKGSGSAQADPFAEDDNEGDPFAEGENSAAEPPDPFAEADEDVDPFAGDSEAEADPFEDDNDE